MQHVWKAMKRNGALVHHHKKQRDNKKWIHDTHDTCMGTEGSMGNAERKFGESSARVDSDSHRVSPGYYEALLWRLACWPWFSVWESKEVKCYSLVFDYRLDLFVVNGGGMVGANESLLLVVDVGNEEAEGEAVRGWGRQGQFLNFRCRVVQVRLSHLW